MKKRYVIIYIALFCSCKGNQNETSLFEDLPIDQIVKDENKEITQENTSIKKVATIIKQTKLNTQPTVDDDESFKLLLPGERVTLQGDTVQLSELNINLLKVVNQYDEEGWVKGSDIILDTKLGVVIKNTETFEKPDIFSARAQTLSYGEIIRVRQSHLKNWYSITRKENEPDYWINNLSFLSFEDVDIKLAKVRKDVLLELPKPNAIFKLQETINDQSNNTSIFYNELTDSLYKYKEDDPIIN